MIKLKEASARYRLKYKEIALILQPHGMAITRNPDFLIPPDYIPLLEAAGREKQERLRIKADRKGKKLIWKRPSRLATQPRTSQTIKEWFTSKGQVTVSELARRINCPVSILVHILNQGQNFIYTENSMILTSRFDQCFSFIAQWYYARNEGPAARPGLV